MSASCCRWGGLRLRGWPKAISRAHNSPILRYITPACAGSRWTLSTWDFQICSSVSCCPLCYRSSAGSNSVTHPQGQWEAAFASSIQYPCPQAPYVIHLSRFLMGVNGSLLFVGRKLKGCILIALKCKLSCLSHGCIIPYFRLG